MQATSQQVATADAIAQAPAVQSFSHPVLTAKYVVLHSGVGPLWARGDVVEGTRFFTDDRQVIQVTKKVLNKDTGRFEHLITEERRLNEQECLAAIHRLQILGAIRPATAHESQSERLDLEKPVSTALVGSNEEKIAQQQAEIEALKQQMSELLQRNVIAHAITETKAANAAAAAPAVEAPQTSTGVNLQPPPGGKPSPARQVNHGTK